MSTKPLFLLRKAKKSSGEPDVVLWASNDFESTCATLDYLIVKSGKKLSSYFKAVATNFPVVNDLPAEGEIDFTWSERYQLSKDSMTWELKPGAAPDNAHYQGNTNVNGEDMTEIEENMLLPISGQELPIRWLAQHGSEKPVTHVSRDGLQALHIARAEELPAVTALAVSHKTSLLDPLEIRELHKLVRDTDKVFPNPGNSNLGLITAFFEAYLNADYTDRGLLTKEWMKGNRVSHITRTASGANAGGGNLTDRGEGFVIIGYRGMIDLARRSGQIASLSARVVREGDEFSFEFGLDEKLIHRPGENEDAPVTHVYAVARLKDGGTQFEVMTRKQIELVRSLSKAGNNGPWVTHWEEMAKKTAIRRLFKYLPVSIEIQRAVSMDEKEPLTIDPADSSVLTGEYSVIDNSEE